MAFPGPQETPRIVDTLGIRDVGLNIYVNGLKEVYLLRNEFEDKGWPRPDGILPADVAAFNVLLADLKTALNDTVAALKGILDLVGVNA